MRAGSFVTSSVSEAPGQTISLEIIIKNKKKVSFFVSVNMFWGH